MFRFIMLLGALVLSSGATLAQQARVTASPPTYAGNQINQDQQLTQTTGGGLRVQMQDGAGNDCSVATPCSVVTAVTGYDNAVVDSTFAVRAAAYTTGQCIGGFRSLAVTTGNSVHGLVQTFSVDAIAAITPTLGLYLFNDNPSASTCDATTGTFTLAAADRGKRIFTPQVFTLQTGPGTTNTFGGLQNLAWPFVEGGGSNKIWYALVAMSNVTFASTDAIQPRIAVSMGSN